MHLNEDPNLYSNTFGRMFRLTTYGESHGPGVGGVIDGCPAGVEIDEADIQTALDERRPGPSLTGGAAATPRREPDKVRLLSGVFMGKTTGTPIAFHVDNTDQQSKDYDALAQFFRPGHADIGFQAKYGMRDHRGGGRSSGRETVGRVAGGAVAQALLASAGVTVLACALELGGRAATLTDIAGAASRPYFCPDEETAPVWHALLEEAKNSGDSLGGLVRVEIHGLPAGLGEPVFDKLDARLAYAFMGVGAVKGVEIGAGFLSARRRGSENNDPILPVGAPDSSRPLIPGGTLRDPGGPSVAFGFAANNAGGVLGGISTGAPLVVTAAVKPIASIGVPQRTITAEGNAHVARIGGRHDVSAIPRIVPVLKAMAALTAADFLLLQRSARLTP